VTARVLVAGIGNIFLGDDGFGVEVVRRLARAPLPDGVELADTGVRGVHLAYQLLEGYRTAILVDLTPRGGTPGELYLIDAGTPGHTDAAQDALMDGHRMSPDAVLALLGTLSAGLDGTRPERVLVVGCEPARLEEGIGLSEPVAAAVDRAVDLVLAVAAEAAGAAAEPATEPGGRTA
jgi:hydrogenase maturation protease